MTILPSAVTNICAGSCLRMRWATSCARSLLSRVIPWVLFRAIRVAIVLTVVALWEVRRLHMVTAVWTWAWPDDRAPVQVWSPVDDFRMFGSFDVIGWRPVWQ